MFGTSFSFPHPWRGTRIKRFIVRWSMSATAMGTGGYCFGDDTKFKRWAEKWDRARELAEQLKATDEGVYWEGGEDEA